MSGNTEGARLIESKENYGKQKEHLWVEAATRQLQAPPISSMSIE